MSVRRDAGRSRGPRFRCFSQVGTGPATVPASVLAGRNRCETKSSPCCRQSSAAEAARRPRGCWSGGRTAGSRWTHCLNTPGIGRRLQRLQGFGRQCPAWIRIPGTVSGKRWNVFRRGTAVRTANTLTEPPLGRRALTGFQRRPLYSEVATGDRHFDTGPPLGRRGRKAFQRRPFFSISASDHRGKMIPAVG